MHKSCQGRGKRGENQKTTNDHRIDPPIDIRIPSLNIPPSSDPPKFFPISQYSKIFPDVKLAWSFPVIGGIEKFSIYSPVPEIFFSESSIGNSEFVSIDNYSGIKVENDEVGYVFLPIRFYVSPLVDLKHLLK